MREYNDHIRLHTPVIRRIIILVMVIIAVPVMLWTITAFVRTYVAQPKLPTFRQLSATALIEAPDSADAATDPAQTAHPIVEARATLSDARSMPIISIRKPAADRSPDTDADMPAGSTQVAATTPAEPVTVLMPATVQPATPAIFVPPAPAGGAALWPDQPGFGPGSAPAAAQSSASNDTTADDLPPAPPITGRIPLPPHRPRLFAMVQAQAGVPVPRTRPVAAPEPAPVETEPAVDRLLIH